MSAPTGSFEMDSLPNKVNPIAADTVLGKDTEDSNNLVEIPIAQLDAYFQAGIKANEIADLIVKALGLSAIVIGVTK